MNVEVRADKLEGRIDAIASKSHAHRLLIAAALSESYTKVNICSTSQDIEATGNCLKQMDEDLPMFNCRESGSTLRFLLPVAMVLKEEAFFFGSGRLPKRPISPLKEEMEKHGCTFENEFRKMDGAEEICHVKGRMSGGIFELPGNVSSQYITGLLFALPLADEDSSIRIITPLESKGYVDMTLDVLEKFGIEVYVNENAGCITYSIRGRQEYISPEEITAEGDWSNMAFWVAAGILSEGKGIICQGTDENSIQGDKEILSIAERMGGNITIKGKSILAGHDKLEGTEIDASAIPDLVPILSVMAATAEGVTRIYNAGRLRIKESDRLKAMTDCLKRLGADVTENPDGLTITGVSRLKGATVNGYNDHRVVMSMAIASIVADGNIIIEGAEAVNKSYSDFFEDFEHLGGEYHVL